VRVLTSRILELEKLQEAKVQVAKTTIIQQWNKTLWNQQKNLEQKLVLVIMFCYFQRKINHT
jgi:hypothetical protein